MAERQRVALVAIAANEAAYVAQFVFHHLKIGFSPIIILTNNSQDETASMVATMADRLSDVIHIDADPWRSIWPIGDFQRRAYGLSLFLINTMQTKPDYVMLLDVDEFWVPLTKKESISEFIDRYGSPDTLMFNWIIPEKDDAPFSNAFIPDFVGRAHNHMKMLWRYVADATILNPHAVSAPNFQHEIVVSGLPLADRRHATVGEPEHPGSAMILHQMYRSQPEYVATLARGNPSDKRPFKKNRWGFKENKNNGKHIALPLDGSICEVWTTEFPVWLERLGLSLSLISGRRETLQRAGRGLDLYMSMTEVDKAFYKEQFQDVDFDLVKGYIESALSDPVRHLHRIP